MSLLQSGSRNNFDSHSSNGWAAHPDINVAAANAKLELIDRHVICKAWENKIGWQPLTPPTIFLFWLKHALPCGWKIRFFKLNARPAVLAMLVQHPDAGSYFDSLCHNSISYRSWLKTGRFLPFTARQFYLRFPQLIKCRKVASPQDSSLFFTGSQVTQRLFRFLDSRSSQQPCNWFTDNELSQINVEILDHKNLANLFVARAWQTNWRPLRWGRRTISGVNKWPHPLA